MPLRLLLIDDDRHDRELTIRVLRDEFEPIEITEVSSESQFKAVLQELHFDAVITDYQLRWNDGLSVLREILSRKSDMPVVMFTGSGTEAICAEAMKSGLSDYIVKDRRHFVRLPAAINAAIHRVHVERELHKSRQRSSEQDEELRQINESLERQVAERTRIAEERATQLRTLAGELTRAEERERRRLAQMLHDDLQQLLVGARIRLATLPNDPNPEQFGAILTEIDSLLDESIKVSRDLTLKFSPPVLYDAGLGPALEWVGRQMASKYGLNVTVDYDDSAQPTAEDTSVLLYQAVRELLFNVRKHSGAVEARVSLENGNNDQTVLTVRDSGRGFLIGDEAKTDDTSGGGFGLFSIRERLELIGGRMELESEPDVGTTVRLFAPKQPTNGHASFTPDVEESRGIPQATESTRSETKPQTVSLLDTSEIRILLADDHRVMRASLAGLLEREPIFDIVGEATDGKEAVELARQVRPDVVVMDISMPEVDGIEATRILKGELPELIVIGLSMHEKDDMQASMLAAGATDYVTKDGPPENLTNAIKLAVDGRRSQN
ncbi:response regulator [Stratiformator vulcanicus]|uniref:response regulator n=1 Tax=Stratiformator vulcanicus TaxID=2527980 RepID=UPI00287726F8|nr:response regulator [Stratiformator vulcanicus]